MAHLLAMTKPLGEICPIAVGETLYQLTSHTLCLQFCDSFAIHFSPHQFKVATKGNCEIIVHNIKCTLDFHLGWVIFQLDMANDFTSMSKGVILQEFHIIGGDIMQFILFVHAYYAFESPLFYNHYNHEGDIIIIPSTMGTC
jgi:hypothetical protein